MIYSIVTMVQNRRYLLRLYITDHHRIFWDQTPTYFLFVNKRRNQSPDLPPFSVDDRPHLCMRQSCVPQKSNQNLLSRLQLMLLPIMLSEISHLRPPPREFSKVAQPPRRAWHLGADVSAKVSHWSCLGNL